VTDIDPGDRRRYVQVALVLRERISSGELPPGVAMPGTRAVKAEFAISIETAQNH
jgi:DNA-binding GntR family transcriptional regulator